MMDDIYIYIYKDYVGKSKLLGSDAGSAGATSARLTSSHSSMTFKSARTSAVSGLLTHTCFDHRGTVIQ